MALLEELAKASVQSCEINKELFNQYNVKRGLRNADFSGVLVGLTNIGNVVGYSRDVNGVSIPMNGELYYRGYEVKDLVHGFQSDGRHGFEEVAYLLLSGKLPNKEELKSFTDMIKVEQELDFSLSKNRSEEHTSELQSRPHLVCRLLLEKKKK